MYMVIFIGIIGIWMFLDIEAAAWDTEIAKHKTELKERDEQLLQVKVKALEEKYQELLYLRGMVYRKDYDDPMWYKPEILNKYGIDHKGPRETVL